MKVLSPTVHGIIDYISVVALALAPRLLGLAGMSATFAYALAAIHLIMTLVTAFPMSVLKVLPLRYHGAVEIIVGVTLLFIPWFISDSADFNAVGRSFYAVFGSVLIVVWFLTNYAGTDDRLRR